MCILPRTRPGRRRRVRGPGRHVRCGQHADVRVHQGLEAGGVVLGRQRRQAGGDHQEVGLIFVFSSIPCCYHHQSTAHTNTHTHPPTYAGI